MNLKQYVFSIGSVPLTNQERAMKATIFLSVIILLTPTCVLADAYYVEEYEMKSKPDQIDLKPGESGADASHDKRLPPVYPGEVVQDSGRKLKVWSTSGPVPVNNPPKAPVAGQPGNTDVINPKEISVIVDQRDSHPAVEEEDSND